MQFYVQIRETIIVVDKFITTKKKKILLKKNYLILKPFEN